jgi:rhamnose transport system permease protein
MALGNIAFAWLSQHQVPILPAFLLVAALATAAGTVNGFLVVAFGLPSLAVTLGALGAYRALALLLGGNEGYADFSDAYVWLGSASLGPLPLSLVLLASIFAAFAALLHATVFGRMLYTIGSNAVTARMSGIRVGRVKVITFALAGFMGGIASLVYIGQYQSARADNAGDMLLLIVTVVVLGGVDIFGGSGTPLGLLLSLLLLGTLKNGMGLANISGPLQTLVIGLVLVISVLATQSNWRLTHLLPGSTRRTRDREASRP